MLINSDLASSPSGTGRKRFRCKSNGGLCCDVRSSVAKRFHPERLCRVKSFLLSIFLAWVLCSGCVVIRQQPGTTGASRGPTFVFVEVRLAPDAPRDDTSPEDNAPRKLEALEKSSESESISRAVSEIVRVFGPSAQVISSPVAQQFSETRVPPNSLKRTHAYNQTHD